MFFTHPFLANNTVRINNYNSYNNTYNQRKRENSFGAEE